MTNQEIFDLIDRFEDSSLQTLKLSTEDFSMELGRGVSSPLPASPCAVSSAASQTVSAVKKFPAITSPLVGTYYAAPAPGQSPFVQAGEQVKKGQTVCLIEAMKMMSEIPAPCNCVIEEVLKTDGELAAFDEPLFRYKPC